MPIITISRAFCSNGKLIAEKVAKELGCECISREILLEASEQFNVPQVKLAKAIHDGPSFFEKLTNGKARYLFFIRSALLNHLKKGDIVYHGLAGHFFLQDIPKILKIRTLADLESRVRQDMAVKNIPAIIARKQILHDDEQRRNWSNYMFKMDTSDPELYDLVLNLKNMSINNCVKIICDTVELDAFQYSDEELKVIEDEALAATVKAAIVEKHHTAVVTSQSGKVVVNIVETVLETEKTKSEIKSAVKDIEGIKLININVKSSSLAKTAMHR